MGTDDTVNYEDMGEEIRTGVRKVGDAFIQDTHNVKDAEMEIEE